MFLNLFLLTIQTDVSIIMFYFTIGPRTPSFLQATVYKDFPNSHFFGYLAVISPLSNFW